MNDEETYPQRFADAVADVVEEARWSARIGSIRELARLSGMTHTSLNKRLAKETPYTVRDLAALAPALKIEPVEVLRRARVRLEEDVTARPAAKLPTIAEKRAQSRTYQPVKKAARKAPGEPKMGD